MRLGIIAAGGTKYSDFCKIVEDFVVRNQIFIFTLVWRKDGVKKMELVWSILSEILMDLWIRLIMG